MMFIREWKYCGFGGIELSKRDRRYSEEGYLMFRGNRACTGVNDDVQVRAILAKRDWCLEWKSDVLDSFGQRSSYSFLLSDILICSFYIQTHYRNIMIYINCNHLAIFYIKPTATQVVMIQSVSTKKFVTMNRHGHISAKVSHAWLYQSDMLFGFLK